MSTLEDFVNNYVNRTVRDERVCNRCRWLDVEDRCRRLHVYYSNESGNEGLMVRESVIREVGTLDILAPNLFGCNQWEDKP